jgi:ATP-dependent RNA helicase SUPV3L1/SUV3
LSRLRGKETLLAAVAGDGGVTVEGAFIGRLEGLNFIADAESGDDGRRALISAAKRALQGEIVRRVDRLVEEPDEAFTLGDDARFDWRGDAVARLSAGADVLSPRIALLHTEFLTADLRARTEARLARWFEAHREAALGGLIALRVADLTGAARGLAFQLVEALGVLPRRAALPQLSVLGVDDRKALRAAGVRLGLLSVFLPAVIKPRAAHLKGLLWSVHRGSAPIAPPAPGRVSVAAAAGVPRGFYEAVGYRIVAGRAIRADLLDRFAIQLMRLARKGPFAPSPDLLSLLGMSGEQIAPVIAALGYRRTSDGEGFEAIPRGHRPRRAKARAGKKGTEKGAEKGKGQAKAKAKAKPARGNGRKSHSKPHSAVDPDSPFAKLKELRLS